MSENITTYRLSNYAIFASVVIAVGLSWFFVWKHADFKLNFMGGDAKDYYSGLVSTFITHDLADQSGNDVFLLKTETGTINVHPIGVSVLLLPFFVFGVLFSALLNFPIDGYSLPFQIATSLAALVYAAIGLIYLKKLLRLQHISDATSALLLILVFFGTNLLNYTLSEAGMSHVYSFSLIAVFLYHSAAFVLDGKNKNLLYSFLIFGLILLVRPNNIFILLSVFIWFRSLEECRSFFKALFRNKVFYLSLFATLLIVFTQSVVWFIQSKAFFHNTYKADGFYWLNPQILKMLFGFDGGFFIYTPLCFLFLLGLPVIYKQNKFSFYSALLFLAVLIYFFASYWAYTYFDGLGIRVLVDYYALFAFFGAKLFAQLAAKTVVYNALLAATALLVYVNLVYTYQLNRSIILRAGMNFDQWKYTFLKTAPEYQMCLGGSHELVPYSKAPVKVILSKNLEFKSDFNFDGFSYGPTIYFDSIGFTSNRINLQIKVNRKELALNSSKEAMICIVHQDHNLQNTKSYLQIRLNEAPSLECCSYKDYSYSANVAGQFEPNDDLTVFLWNVEEKAFLVNQFSVQVYNHNYKIN